jgi:hypothetical protein
LEGGEKSDAAVEKGRRREKRRRVAVDGSRRGADAIVTEDTLVGLIAVSSA